MTIAPVTCTLEVRADPARAFDLFTGRMGEWWNGKTIGEKPHVAIVVEPHVDGRWYERDAEGTECTWGKVIAWDPPGRLVLGWQLNSQFKFDPALLMEVELSFTPIADGGTRVRLEHRDLEQYGADAERLASLVGGGWQNVTSGFPAFVEAQTAMGEKEDV